MAGSRLGAVWSTDMAQDEQQQRIQGPAEEEGSEGEEAGGHRPCLGGAAVGVLLRMGDQWMEQAVRTAMVAAGAGGGSSSDMGGSRGSESQGDLAETELGMEKIVASTGEERATDMRQAESAAEAEATADAAGWMEGEVAAPPGATMAGSAVPEGTATEVRTAEAVAAAAATADVKEEVAAVHRGTAAEGETVEEMRVRLSWMRKQKEGTAPAD